VSDGVPLDRGAVLEAVRKAVVEPSWQTRLKELAGLDDVAVHVAVMVEPYLRLLLEGRKTIESRFSRNRINPFEAISTGDVVVLKRQSGPLVGLAEIAHVGFYELDPPTWRDLRQRFERPLCATDDEFWDVRAEARYATLLSVRRIAPIEPVLVAKSDRRGWVRLGGAENRPAST
jgi:hypothetical protein